MIRNYGRCVLPALFLSVTVVWSMAAEGLPEVTDVVVRGNEKVSTARVLYYVKVGAGDIYSRDALNADVGRLTDSGLFAWASAFREEYEGGYRGIFEVVERAVVKEIEFRGNRRIGKRRLSGMIQTEVEKSLAPYTVMQDVVAIAGYYAKKGFAFADVRPFAEKVAEGVRVVYEISEGPRVRVSAVRYRGNVSFSTRALKKAVRNSLALIGMKGTKSGFWFFSKGRLNVDTLQAEANGVEDFYRESGWIDCRVGVDLDFNEERTRATVTMVVDEGVLYRVGRIVVVGNAAIEAAVLVGSVVVKVGDAFSTGRLEGDGERIRLLYGSRGYADAEAQYRYRVAEEGALDLVWEVREGKEFRIGRIDIYGNYHTKDKVVRRELSFYPGEMYNAEEIRKSEMRLKGKGYFEKAEIEPVQSREEDDVKEILVNVAEGRTGQVVLSAGITSNLGFAGSIQVRQSNFDLFDWPKGWKDLMNGDAFVGGGQSLTLRYEPGAKYHVYQVSFREPYLFDRPLIFGTNLYDTQYRRRNYDEGRLGAELTFGKRWGRTFSLELGLARERVEISDVDTDAPSVVMAFEGESWINRAQLMGTYDRRDRVFSPSSGYRLSGAVELGGTFLGGDVDYVKETVSASFYKTLSESLLGYKHVAAVAIRGGQIEAIGDTDDVPFFERFYLGGQRSVRGFEYRGIGPREDGDPIGGTVFASGSVEYSFPLYEDTLRWVFFVDAGNLAEDVGDLKFDEFRVSAGFGLRFAVPFLGPEPISLDFGFPVKKEPGDDTEMLSFGLAFGM